MTKPSAQASASGTPSASSRSRMAAPFTNDPQSKTHGGWKVHLSIGPESYDERATKVERWLRRNYRGEWKALDGGDMHEKDFTIYLGSYDTMMGFVGLFERSRIVGSIDSCKASTADRIVGSTGKCGARFDPRGSGTREVWYYGHDGVPFTLDDKRAARAKRKSPTELAAGRKNLLREQFGDYFLPPGAD